MGLYPADAQTSVRMAHELSLEDLWERYTQAMGELQVAQMGSMAAGAWAESTVRLSAWHRVPQALDGWNAARAAMLDARTREEDAFYTLSHRIEHEASPASYEPDPLDVDVLLAEQDDDDGKPNAMQLFGDGS